MSSVEIPNSVTSVGSQAFWHCESLTNIEIPNSVISIGNGAFAWCPNLTSIIVDADNSVYDSRENCNAIIKTGSNTLIAGCQNSKIPNSVTSIGEFAFYYCSKLTSIEIPKNVINVGSQAFSCCTNLKEITCLAATPPAISQYTFNNCKADLYVPAGCKVAYESADYWKKFTNIIELPTLAESLVLDMTEASIEVNETVTFIAMVLPNNTTNKVVAWKSSDNTVATVSANGVVTAVALGEAVITATTTDGTNLSATCKVTVVPTLAETITLDKTEISLEATETTTLVATVLPELTTNKSVTWTSSNEAVATVDANGVVTAIAVGEATITATTTDGSDLSASCKVTVVPTLAETIALDKTEISLEATETATLVATVLPETATNKSVTWASSNEAVATVDDNGEVTAIALGEAIITATTTDGSNLSASCKVTVVPTMAETITLDKTEIRLEANETATLVATVLPELTTNKSVTWNSSNESVAIVDENGVVTAIAVGEATITATTTDGSNLSTTCKVTVVPTLAETITLDKTEISLEATETATLVASVLPELTTDKSVEWSSSNEAVATVDANGVVTAIALGEAIITATTTDGSNLSASCKVTVVPTLAETITLDKTEISLEATETATLVATVLPELTTNKSVTWTSSNEAVATVDANGVVTAIAVGEAVITATTTDGSDLSASCQLTVVPTLATSIELDKTEISLEATETATLIATVLPELTTDKSVKWASSDETVVVVDENGVVTAVAVGEATITATTVDDSNLFATCKVTVIPTLATSIELDKTEISLEATETATLVATVLPELTTNKSVTWTSSNEAVATVDANGVVTAIAVGEATITATTTDGSNLSATCKVTVVATLAETITLDKTEISFEATETATLVATVLPELTTNKSVTWKSSNEAIATVDANGKVTAIAVGEATITATTTDGSNLSATCKVTVVPTMAETITLDKTEISIEATETATLVATVLPELTTNKSVVWTSSNEAVATVDANGVVTAIAVGEAVITATTTDGTNLSASCQVTVVPTLVVSIEVTPNSVEAEENSEVQLSVNILPENATYKSVEWSSSNDAIASVNANGLVKIRKEGNVVITATTTDGTNLSATCSINVYSGIDGVNGNDVIVATIGDNIVVKNAKLGSNVRVYAADGAMIATEIVTDGSVVIEAPIKGIYVVAIDGKSFKVMVK